MPLLPQRSSKATDRGGAGRALVRADADWNDPALPILLEFQSPSTAITSAAVPRSARRIVWIIASMFAVCAVAIGVIPVDRVVTAQGKVVTENPTLVVQPLDTSIVRSIDVREGQSVHAGQVLARLDPTFAVADEGALAAQVGALQAEVARLQAEAEGRPFTYTGLDPNLSLQAAIFQQRQSEYNYRIENYREKADSLVATIARALSDAQGYRDRLAVASNLENMRKDLENLKVGSKLNTLLATDNRMEMQRYMQNAQQAAEAGKRDLMALNAERDGYIEGFKADISQKLSDATGKLSDARESLNKAQLHRQLVELRADRDATVLTVARVSVGSVLQPGQQLITLVPADAPLEVEANISGTDDGFVHVGDPVSIKFDTFPFAHYGMAYGTVRVISPDSFTAEDQARMPTANSVPVPQGSTMPFYRARIAIDRMALRDVPADFHAVPGMPVTADVKVGKHTVLNYLLGRIIPVASEGMREP